MSDRTEEEIQIDILKQDFLQKRQDAEKAAYAYCCACPVGDEREIAFEMYERVRNVTRIYS